MSQKLHDFLRIAVIVLAALATLVTTVFGIWSIPYGEMIGATIMAIVVCIETILQSDSSKYFADKFIFSMDDAKTHVDGADE